MHCEATAAPFGWPSFVIADRYYSNPDATQHLKAVFRASGYVKLPQLLTAKALQVVFDEVMRLHSHRVRREFVMPAFETTRRMSVLGGQRVVRESPGISSIYACQHLHDWIASFVGTQVHAVAHDEEFLVVNFLDGERDTHGWHLDDPQYALVVVVESPSPLAGGHIEYIPGWFRLSRELGFDAHREVEQGVQACRRMGRVRADVLESGDCYLLNAAEVLHRVTPMFRGGSRKALNLAFDDRRYRIYGDTATRLYA